MRKLAATSGLQMYTFYPKERRDDLASLWHLGGNKGSLKLCVVGNGYLQDVGPGWNEHHALRYHIYKKRNEYDLKNALACTYGASLKSEGYGVLENMKCQGLGPVEILVMTALKSWRWTNEPWRRLRYL